MIGQRMIEKALAKVVYGSKLNVCAIELLGGLDVVLDAKAAAESSMGAKTVEVNGKLLGGHLTVTLTFNGERDLVK